MPYEVLSRNGKIYSAIPTGLKARVFRSTDLGELQNSKGWIFHSSGKKEEWPLEGVMEREEELIFYGPALKGCPFRASLLTPERFSLILKVFLAMKDEKDWEGFYAPGWVFLGGAEERILLLPLKVMNFICHTSAEHLRQEFWYPYNSPGLSGERSMVFTSALLACLCLKSPHPYAPLEKDEGDRNEQLRRPPLLPPDLLIPGLAPESAALIKASLPPDKTGITLQRWLKEAESWKEKSPIRPLSPEEKESVKKKAAFENRKGVKGQNRRQFLRKKGSFYGILLLGLALFLTFVSIPVKKALEPPLTMGLSPLKVVELYYGCFDSLNQELMEDCAKGSIAKEDLRQVTNLFVTGRVRMGYEGQSGLISARQWLEEGRPALKQGVHVYGITGLNIKTLKDHRFKAEYAKWLPGATPEKNQKNSFPRGTRDSLPAEFQVVDILELKQERRGNWRIESIIRSSKPEK